VLLVFSDPKHAYGLHVLCERGRQGRALTRWDVRGKAGRSPGTVSQFAVSLKSSRLAVERRSVVCNGPAISESDFELFFENRLGDFCFAVDAYRWFF
jgi:hypothetical protein